MSKPENVKCPVCGGPMVIRTARADQRKFWGCQRYPACKGTLNTDGEARQPAHSDGDDASYLPSERMSRNDRQRWRNY